MWKVILAVLATIPWEVVIPWFFAQLSGMSYELSKKLIDKAVEFVVEVEEKYGSGNGEQKAREVKQKLSEIAEDISTWLLNFLNELAVAYAKRKGLIK